MAMVSQAREALERDAEKFQKFNKISNAKCISRSRVNVQQLREIEISYTADWMFQKFTEEFWSAFLKIHFEVQIFGRSDLTTTYTLASAPMTKHTMPS